MDFVKSFLKTLLLLCLGIAALCVCCTIIVTAWAYLSLVVLGMSVDYAIAVGLVLMIAGLTLAITLDK